MSELPNYIAPSKVLTPSDMMAVLEGTGFLHSTRQLHSQAEEVIQKAGSDAQNEGYQRGYQEGREAAFEDLADAIKEARSRIMASENDLANVMMTALERMLGQIDSVDLAKRCLQQSLKEAVGLVEVKIKVSADEYDSLKNELKNIPLNPDMPEIRSVDVDPLLKSGEILLETPKGRIHVGLKQQLSRLRSGLEHSQS